MTETRAYQKPGEMGGKLIRVCVRALRNAGLELPLGSHILIAASGGADSTALLLLLARYGRRIIAPDQIEVVHVHHGWRAGKSDEDARFVEALSRRLGLSCQVHRVCPPREDSPDSWEDHARQQRKEIFARLAREREALVLTAHQADDLAETLIWRIMTGAALTHGAGIAVRHGVECRPLLQVRKESLQAFLKEEGQPWCEDETNHGGRFLRSRIRQELLPVLERLFPRSVEHLLKLALGAQRAAGAESALPEAFLGMAGIRPRRPHWETLSDHLRREPNWQGALDLPGGWRLRRELGRALGQDRSEPKRRDGCLSPPVVRREKWTLERG